MKWKQTILAAILVCGLALPNLAMAQNIKGPAQITPSTNIPTINADPNFAITQIADNFSGDPTPYRGFVGRDEVLGKINFAFDKPYNVSAFHMFNDVNISMEGVSQFTLRFFDAANTQVGAPKTFNVVQGAAQQQNFPLGSVANVSKVEMTVDSIFMNTNYRRVEIREASFTGDPSANSGNGTTGPSTTGGTCPGVGCTDANYSTCCPPTATFDMGTLFKVEQPNLNGDYYINFKGLGALDAQMVAYVNYLRVLDPAHKGLAMSVRIFDGGNGPTAIASGAALEPDSGIYWNAGTSSGALWPNASFFGPGTIRPVNNWVVIEMVVWTQGPGRGYSQSCERRLIKYRPNMVNGRAALGSGFSAYTGPAPTSSVRQPAPRR